MHSLLGADHPHDGILATSNTRNVIGPQDDEMPLEYMPALIPTPFSGYIVDRHNVGNILNHRMIDGAQPEAFLIRNVLPSVLVPCLSRLSTKPVPDTSQ